MKTDKFTLFVYCNFLVLLSTPVCSQNINKQNVNTADETLTNYSFLSRYHHTIHTIEFPCLLGHPGYIYIFCRGISALEFFSYILQGDKSLKYFVYIYIFCRSISPFNVFFFIYTMQGDQSL